ncbi:MAG: uroporphyrinogen-III synthase, partial [Deltaproteobacteria bacterium]|nr:uroporphyrinogen-III synthase [Deltaproteobacteria bacterium]
TATQTLVIFMGMRKLDSLATILIENGRPASTPAAVIQWASLPTQRTVVGTLANIHERASRAGLGLPALTIVGEVVRLRSSLRWFDTKPLFGKRVLVTRAVRQAGALAALLRDEGAQAILAPTIRLAPVEDLAPLRDSIAGLNRYDWILFTSSNSVEIVLSTIEEAGLDLRALAGVKVCAIGGKTRLALRSRGIVADLVPEDARAEGVLAQLGPLLRRGSRVLLPRAEIAREVLPDSIRELGAEVDVVAVYRNLPPAPTEAERIRAFVDSSESDAVLFTSSSTVRNLVELLGPAAADRLGELDLFSIGPVTSQTAESLGLTIAATSAAQTIESLVETVHAYYAPLRDAYE